MKLAVVDYGSGNLRSAAKAFERAVAESGRDEAILVTDDPDKVARADRVVLPGVGAFADCMAGLAAVDGMPAAVREAAIERGRPFLGICVGMQLMATLGREHGVHRGFDWIAGEVVAIEPQQNGLKIPHMGWNDLHFDHADHPVFAGVAEGAHAYAILLSIYTTCRLRGISFPRYLKASLKHHIKTGKPLSIEAYSKRSHPEPDLKKAA